MAHLPALPGESRTRLAVGAHARPWPGVVQVADAVTGARVAELGRRASLGRLVAELASGPTEGWDGLGVLEVSLHAGHLSSADPAAVLEGVNRLAVEGVDGWEIIGFAQAELLSAGRYRLTQLLRGRDGTLPAEAPAGARILLLDGRMAMLAVEPHWLGQVRSFRIYAGARDVTGTSLDVVL